MKRIRLLLCALALTGAGAHAQSTPAEIIDALGLAIRPDASSTWDAPRRAETAAAEQLRALIAAAPGQPALTAADALGRTPLMRAALNGYAEVVAALLADDSVRAGLETRDRFGATAWSLSQFARPLTLLSCHPQMLALERAPLWRPYLQRSAYFLQGGVNRFQHIGQLLTAAGARADDAAARAAWQAMCPGHDEDAQQKISAAPQLLRGLMLDTNARLQRLNDKALQASGTLVANPAPIRLAWPDAADVWQQPWPKLMLTLADRAAPAAEGLPAVRCTRMGRPDIPRAIQWTGQAPFRVLVEIQAGVPTVAEIRRVDGLMDRRAQALIQVAILRTLATYECPGDHLIEQEFQFKIQ